MTTLLLKWPDKATSVACGTAMGCTTQEEGENQTAPLFNGLNLSVIGEHSYVSDGSDPESPTVSQVPGWWVLLWLGDASGIDGMLASLPAPLRPEIFWRSDAMDDNGDPVPRPPVSECPQTVVA